MTPLFGLLNPGFRWHNFTWDDFWATWPLTESSLQGWNTEWGPRYLCKWSFGFRSTDQARAHIICPHSQYPPCRLFSIGSHNFILHHAGTTNKSLCMLFFFLNKIEVMTKSSWFQREDLGDQSNDRQVWQCKLTSDCTETCQKLCRTFRVFVFLIFLFLLLRRLHWAC